MNATERTFAVGNDEVQLLRDGAQAFPAMLAAIAGARREILLEMYWVGDDDCGRRFRDALAERARHGVTVKVVVDAVGSLALTPSFWMPLTASGGAVSTYHPVRALVRKLDLARLDRRDHRKILVVDGEVGFLGGINLARHWLAFDDGGEGWRDDAVSLRGPAAAELRAVFFEAWRRAAEARGPFPRVSARQDGPVAIVASGRTRRRSIRREYLRRLRRARERIDIANSYFVPDVGLRGALFRARARGVRVRVLVPMKSDVPLVQLASEALFDRLVRRGIEVYAYPETILHAKTAIIDDVTTIGSYNFDERSFRKNLEANVFIDDRAFARHARAWFEHDLAQAERIDLARWRERGVARRVGEALAFALRRLW